MSARLGVSGHQSVPATAMVLFREVLDELLTPESIGVSSLAAGADQVFAYAVLHVGGSLIAVVPSRNYETTFSGAAQRAAYRELISASDRVIRLPYSLASEEAFMAAGRRVVDESDLLIALWDGKPARGLGGTGDVVAYAHGLGRPVRVVWPPGASR